VYSLINNYPKITSFYQLNKFTNVLTLNPNFVVKFTKRQANMVAHKLARAAIVGASCYVVDVLPLCITSLVNNEMI
jgi:predicted lipoprotein